MSKPGLAAVWGARAGVWATCVALVSAGGCAAARRPYEAPAPSIPVEWSVLPEPEPAAMPGGRALAQWWTTFNDPMLTRLVETAVERNLDVQTALSRIRQARASLAATRGNLRPAVDGSAAPSASRSSGEAGSGTTGSVYQAGFDASWEADIFGRIRREIDVAAATAQGREAGLADALVTLAADVATSYIAVREAQARLAIAQDSAAAQEETYDLTRFRQQAGLSTDLEVSQALANLESTRAQMAALDGQTAQSRHALAVLLALEPAALDQDLSASGAIPDAPLSIAVGVPAEALRRRPDIRAAERDVAAQAAQVNAARADLYPRFRLAGSLGLQALNLAKLFVPGAAFWNIGPSVSVPLFDRTQIQQNLLAQTEVAHQALLAYESTVLAALREVEDALHAFVNERIRRERLESAAAAARQAADLSLQLYTAGLRDFRDVLDAQRSLLTLQDQLASSQANIAIDLVRTYKAIGGGWQPMSAP